MLIKPFNSDREVSVNIFKYRIDWRRKVSGPQFSFKKFVYPYWKYDVVLEEFTIPKSGGKRVDFFNVSKGLVVEISPAAIHFEYNKFMHGSRAGFEKKIKSDVDKLKWAESNGWRVLEVVDEDLEPGNLNRKHFEDKYGISL